MTFSLALTNIFVWGKMTLHVTMVTIKKKKDKKESYNTGLKQLWNLPYRKHVTCIASKRVVAQITGNFPN